MNSMFRTLKIASNINVASFMNWFIYYIKKTPLIGRLFKNVNYLNIQSKKVLSVFLIIFNMLKSVFLTGLYSLLLIAVPLLIIVPDSITSSVQTNTLAFDSFLHLYFFLYILLFHIITCSTLEPKRTKFICVKLMRMDAYEYCVASLLSSKIWSFIVSLPVFIGYSLLFNGTIMQAVILCFYAKFLGFFMESIHLWVFHKKRFVIHNNNKFSFINLAIFSAIAYVPIILKKPLPLENLLFQPLTFAIVISMGVLGILYIFQYPDYKLGIDTTNSIEGIAKVDVKQITKDSKFADVKLKEKHYSKNDLISDKYNNKSGFEYLNALFFNRHRRQIIRPVKYRLAIIGLLLILGIVATYLWAPFKKNFFDVVFRYYPALIFGMYMLSSTVQKATKAMFYNCDISLLHYGFYKKGNALLKMFWLRLNYLAGLNLLPAALLSATLLVLAYLVDPSMIVRIVPISIFILVLALFFSVHYLFLYYILQPYTTELNMKSPAYSIVNTITYIVCYACLQIEAAPRYFVLIVMAATIIYMVIALLLVLKFAKKTFNVK